ncbi:M6 family metalloprotease domain-containing protein, partial [Streptomyces sp. NPDC057545]
RPGSWWARCGTATRPPTRPVRSRRWSGGCGGRWGGVPSSAESGYAVEVRTTAGNDEEVCRPGVLIYRVSSNVDTGQGPVSVVDSTKKSGGCTRVPNVHAELSDAAFRPGQTFTDRATGIRISVVEKDDEGNYRVRISRP